MIKTEIVTIKRRKFIHTWSDENYYIRQLSTGNVYSDALDLKAHPEEYEETDEKIPEEPEPEQR